MKTILDKIMAHKSREVAERQALYPIKLLEQSIYFETSTVSLKSFLRRPSASGIIAEFKRQSPSAGKIQPYAEAGSVSLGYMQAGASALSVLTDSDFFGGSHQDLHEVRQRNYAPILNKDFILSEYQLIEAKSAGADVALLIAACLEKKELRHLTQFAQHLDLQVLVEIHEDSHLDKLPPEVDYVGINNRNLHTFEVDLGNSLRLVEQLPAALPKIAESGLSKAPQIAQLRQAGFEGFLIGGYFMKQSHPAQACAQLVQELQALDALQKPAYASLTN